MKSELIISVIIPIYNMENYVINALESIKNQKNIKSSQYEVIIIDDGSKDNSKAKILDWISKENVTNFKYYEKENGNWGSVINYAKNNKLINGKFFTILDADDYFLDNAFYSFLPYLKENNDLVISNYYENKNNKLKKTNVIFSAKTKSINKKNAFTCWSIPLCKFFKTKLFYEMDNLEEKVSYQDQILYHSFVLNKAQTIFFIKKHLGVYWVERIGSSSAQAWDENRINVWMKNMNKLLSMNSNELNAYVLIMIWHAIKESKHNSKFIKLNNEQMHKLKKSKLNWLPFGFRNVAKQFFLLTIRKCVVK